MTTVYQPVLSDIADLFTWKTRKTLTSITVGNSGQVASENIKTLSDSYFCLVAFRGSTNYDSVSLLRAVVGAPAGAAATGIYPSVVPNNFEVLVKRSNRVNMMDQPMPQACIASTGYRAGQQVPIPILYPPLTTFNIFLYATAPNLFTQVDGTTQIDLKVDFGLFGYNIKAKNLEIFIRSWPELYSLAMTDLTGISQRGGM